MYWPRPEKDLYWFWGQRIKGQGHIWSLNFVSFPHDIHLFLAYNNDTSQMYWPWPEKDLYRFGVNRLKIKVKFGLKFLQFVFPPFLFDNSISFWYTMMILHTCIKRDPRRTSVDFGVKSQGNILTLNFVPFPHGDPISFWHTMMIWWGQEVKDKGYSTDYVNCPPLKEKKR